jgi:hypothetical protein
VTARPKQTFTAEPGDVSGTVKVTAQNAGQRTCYVWQYSADSGKTWVGAPQTMQAHTTIPGLTPGSTVSLRYRTVTKTGESDWSQPTSIIVS